ncbi:alpha/beta hydrolase [Kaistia dalseonensis]|uniref:Pimeloyl-ACP methyl ester carboxylesterase n=1 Tax=Kaistia dalseonensis TaxID=410840 RepID=A0ABU0H5J5_9HYPH|nr:alpha/beta hydrolase [Kaistia dalseonensis]MCX5495007.1 alpha/beta hydrolase [Kaistia dalseonensis]MDQ0437588.1 pimeloyl-ACP methyl ester carboxylesterase [Kaistia dalseonensis]
MQLEHNSFVVGADAAAREIAVLQRGGNGPGIFFLGGFMSDMRGSKAEALDHWGAEHGRAVTRFDYSGHGASGGAFADGTISRWLEEAEAVFTRFTTGPQILVGSSMGGWIAVLLAIRLGKRDPARVAGLVLLAPAIDMTESLMLARMPEAARLEMETTGAWRQPSAYSDTPYLITKALIDDGRQHLLGETPIAIGAPVHIIQGVLDEDVPWGHAVDLVSRLAQDDVVLTLIKDAGHRLSRPEDLSRIVAAVEAIA